MVKQTTKRCHWVAQSYLKAFSTVGDKRRIWRCSRDLNDIELKRIDKVAVKFHLYAPLSLNGRRDDSFERKLAQLENFFGHDVWKEVCEGFPDFSWQPMRQMIALLVSVSWARTPVQFEYWKNTYKKLVKFLEGRDTLPELLAVGDKEYYLDTDSWEEYRDASEDDLKANWINWVGQASYLAELLLRMRWSIVVSDEPSFITSDNPVILGDTIRPHPGLVNPEAMVTFPLSPTRVLLMDNRHSEPHSRFYPASSGASPYNLLMFRNAMDHVFCHKDPREICVEMVAHAEEAGFKSSVVTS